MKNTQHQGIAHHEPTGNRLIEVDENGLEIRVLYNGLHNDISSRGVVIDGLVVRPLVSDVFRENDEKSKP